MLIKLKMLKVRQTAVRLRAFASSVSPEAKATIDADVSSVAPDEGERLRAEAELEVKRNKSRLSPAHFNIMHDRVPYETPMHWSHSRLGYNRKLYGKYGSQSGFDPALCWMTPEELEDKLEYERLKYPQTLRQMMNDNEKRKAEQRAETLRRDEEIAQRVAKFDKWKADLEDRNAKKLAAANAAKEKKDRLIEEVRRHFGFKISPRDERFKTLLEEKEKQQKKAEKEVKKAAREARILLKLQQKAES